MARERIYRESKKTPEERAREKAVREQFQREKPTPDQLIEEGHTFERLGDVLERHAIAAQLRQERERRGIPLRELADRTGMDQPSLSRFFNEKTANPTLATLERVAEAFGKHIQFLLIDKQCPVESQSEKIREFRIPRRLLPSGCRMGDVGNGEMRVWIDYFEPEQTTTTEERLNVLVDREVTVGLNTTSRIIQYIQGPRDVVRKRGVLDCVAQRYSRLEGLHGQNSRLYRSLVEAVLSQAAEQEG